MLGFVIGGFGTGEAADQHPGMLAASLAPLPPAALRMAAGISTPHQVRGPLEHVAKISQARMRAVPTSGQAGAGQVGLVT